MDGETRRLLRTAVDSAARHRVPYVATDGIGRWSAAHLARRAAKVRQEKLGALARIGLAPIGSDPLTLEPQPTPD